jgi:hypothetical protein
LWHTKVLDPGSCSQMLVRPPLGELDLAQITSAVVRYQAQNNRMAVV